MQGYLKVNQDKVVGPCHTQVRWDTVLNVQDVHLTILWTSASWFSNMTN